jgi:hypothetical protein
VFTKINAAAAALHHAAKQVPKKSKFKNHLKKNHKNLFPTGSTKPAMEM